MEMVKLPKGVTVEVSRKKWRGEIPAAICPVKYLTVKKPDTAQVAKSDTVQVAKPATTGNKNKSGEAEK